MNYHVLFICSSDSSTTSETNVKKSDECEKRALFAFLCILGNDQRWCNELGAYINFHCLCRELQFEEKIMKHVNGFY